MAVLVRGYGARLIVEGAAPELAAALGNVLPSGLTVTAIEGPADADARFSVVPMGPGHYEIRSQDQRLATAQGNTGLLQSLQTHLELAIALFARSGTFVHAGAVGWRSRAILVPGPSYAGKSTLVAELVRRGAVYLSDEYAVIDDEGYVHAYPRPLQLRQGGAPLRPPHGTEPLEPALIVSSIYRPGALWAPMIRRGARALLPILDNVIAMKARPEDGMRVAALLAPRVVTVQCERPEASRVALSILQFVDRILDQPGGLDTARRAAS